MTVPEPNAPTSATREGTTSPRWSRILIFAGTLLLLGAVSWIDYAIGASINLLALYFVPLLLAGWYFGTRGAAVFTILATGAWLAVLVAVSDRHRDALLWGVNAFATALGFMIVASLVALLRSVLRRERALARTDPLTGLSNRRQMTEGVAIAMALCKRLGTPATMVSIDLDNFKAVNDSFGHQRGDELLRVFSGILRRFARASDFTSRMGGDEFALFLPDTGAAEAQLMLERIRLAAESTPEFLSCAVTLSVGIYSEEPVRSELEAMLSAADARMYEAKRSRRS